jgi:hypothetical protein
MAYTVRTPEKDAIFFEEFARSANVSAACILAGYSRTTVYEYRNNDVTFAKNWELADKEATVNLEAEMYRRAVFGVHRSEPIMHKGKIVATREIDEYSDTLAIFLAKARNPDKYRERIEVNVNWRQEAKAAGVNPDKYLQSMIDQARLLLEQSSEILDVTASMNDTEVFDGSKSNEEINGNS